MDTAEAMRQALKALEDAGVPEALWPTALPLVFADIRRDDRASDATAADSTGPALARNRSKPSKPRAKTNGTRRDTSTPVEPAILATLTDEETLFKSIEKETGVSVSDLDDLFHIENGRLEIKAPGRDLGASKKAGAQTIAALLGGVVFAGTSHRKLPFKEITEVCRAKHLFDTNNSAANLKTTPGFTAVGSGSNQALTSRSGWQDEFSKAVNRALKKPPPATD